jgi:hypothetical protein
MMIVKISFLIIAEKKRITVRIFKIELRLTCSIRIKLLVYGSYLLVIVKSEGTGQMGVGMAQGVSDSRQTNKLRSKPWGSPWVMAITG